MLEVLIERRKASGRNLLQRETEDPVFHICTAARGYVYTVHCTQWFTGTFYHNCTVHYVGEKCTQSYNISWDWTLFNIFNSIAWISYRPQETP